jgi:hypothetical protein
MQKYCFSFIYFIKNVDFLIKLKQNTCFYIKNNIILL